MEELGCRDRVKVKQMNSNNKISIIVPVYKVEQYLYRCVNSIIHQTYHNLEIFLVDDGSPDGCGAMCDHYASQDSRVRVVHKANGGLSDARNVALNLITGKFVMFVDSDDWIELDACEKLLNLLLKYDADIVSFGMVSVYPSGKKVTNVAKHSGVISSSYGIKCLISYDDFVGNYAWNKIYKSELFKDIRYPKGLLYEDQGTTYKTFHKAKKIYLCQEPLYYYWQRGDSITGNWFMAKSIKDRVRLWSERLEFLKIHYPELVPYQAAQILGDLRVGLIKNTKEPDYNEFQAFADGFIKKYNPSINILPHYSRKLKLLYRFYPAFYFYVKYLV